MHTEKTLECEMCGKKFATEKQVALHTRSCGKLYMCIWCNVPYANLEGVTRHQQNIHTAFYRQAKALKRQHLCYTVVKSDSVR